MRLIQIESLPNGTHRNQSGDFSFVPEGYAVIPKGMETPNFPLGDIEVEEINGVMTVTKWIPGLMPEMEEEIPPISPMEQLRADVDYIAAMTGVEL